MPNPVKVRLDQLLLKKGLFPSREKARAAVMAGLVYVDGQREDKPGSLVNETVEVEIKGETCPYVSRGGLKLEKALHEFNINLNGKIVMDIGASTGGFTHCALLHGAQKVYAVDVGYGQLAWELRQDERVVPLERTNARYLTRASLQDDVDLVTIDVSFISLDKILPVLPRLLTPEGQVIALIKPQFEAGKEKVGKNGVVRSPEIHREVIFKVIEHARDLGFEVSGLDYSPVTGPKGNIEYLVWLTLSGYSQLDAVQERVDQVVAEAHRILY